MWRDCQRAGPGGGGNISLIKLFLERAAFIPPAARGPAAQSLSLPNEGPLGEAHKSAAVRASALNVSTPNVALIHMMYKPLDNLNSP